MRVNTLDDGNKYQQSRFGKDINSVSHVTYHIASLVNISFWKVYAISIEIKNCRKCNVDSALTHSRGKSDLQSVEETTRMHRCENNLVLQLSFI